MEKTMTFEELTKRISPTLRRITYRLNGHYSFFNDDDLYQEAMVHLWHDFTIGRLSDKTDSYILQGCYFHLKNYIRTIQDKTRLVSLDGMVTEDGMDLEEILPAQDTEPYFEYLNSKLLVEKMQNNGLSREEKTVLYFILEGLTMRQIAEKMGISHVSVLKLKNKIKDRYVRFFRE